MMYNCLRAFSKLALALLAFASVFSNAASVPVGLAIEEYIRGATAAVRGLAAAVLGRLAARAGRTTVSGLFG